MGERSPINDVNARGAFIGLSMDTARADMVQAVMEGVAFALRDSVEKARELGIAITASNICGGGAKSPVWKTILANVLGMRLDTVKTEEGPGYGGAILAMIGCGRFSDAKQACESLVSVSDSVYPDPALQALYEKKYQNFRRLYPALKETFQKLKDDD